MDIEEKMRQVPFGMSRFQIRQFINDQDGPERAYRNALLQYNQKMKAMKECEFRRKRWEIDIEEIKSKLSDPNALPYDKRRFQVDLEEKNFYLTEEIKLIEDCAIEINEYKNIIDSLPEFTREDFENGEIGYWRQRLIGAAERERLATGLVGAGTLESLEKIGLVIAKDIKTGFPMICEGKYQYRAIGKKLGAVSAGIEEQESN